MSYMVWFPREAEEIECPDCGTPASRVQTTYEERKEHGCGRMIGCCSRAFLCPNGHRTVGKAEAPEMELY